MIIDFEAVKAFIRNKFKPDIRSRWLSQWKRTTFNRYILKEITSVLFLVNPCNVHVICLIWLAFIYLGKVNNSLKIPRLKLMTLVIKWALFTSYNNIITVKVQDQQQQDFFNFHFCSRFRLLLFRVHFYLSHLSLRVYILANFHMQVIVLWAKRLSAVSILLPDNLPSPPMLKYTLNYAIWYINLGN